MLADVCAHSGAFAPAAGVSVILSGGLTASTVFWVIGGAFSTGAGAAFQGIVITTSTIDLGANTAYTGKNSVRNLVKVVVNDLGTI